MKRILAGIMLAFAAFFMGDVSAFATTGWSWSSPPIGSPPITGDVYFAINVPANAGDLKVFVQCHDGTTVTSPVWVVPSTDTPNWTPPPANCSGSYGGVDYMFVANSRGGDGLVLDWPSTTPTPTPTPTPTATVTSAPPSAYAGGFNSNDTGYGSWDPNFIQTLCGSVLAVSVPLFALMFLRWAGWSALKGGAGMLDD